MHLYLILAYFLCRYAQCASQHFSERNISERVKKPNWQTVEFGITDITTLRHSLVRLGFETRHNSKEVQCPYFWILAFGPFGFQIYSNLSFFCLEHLATISNFEIILTSLSELY